MNRVYKIAENWVTMTYWEVRFHISSTATQIPNTLHNPDKIVAYRLCDRGSTLLVFLFITSATTCSVVSRGCCGVLGCGAECFDPPKWWQHLPVDIVSYPSVLNVHHHRYKNLGVLVELFDVEYIYGFVGWGVCMQSR